MKFRSHIRDWQDMASHDPLRAISGQKRNWQQEEFLATAKPHVDQLFEVASSIGLPKAYDRVLEFGCGAGRFLRYFEMRFAEVWGVDVSQDMIDLAKKYNPRCRFHLNATADLRFFPAGHFDLIYSFLVLQHLPHRSLIEQYLREFIRILKPGGLAAFQVPDRLGIRWRIQPRRRIYHVLHSLGFSSKRLQGWNLLPMSLIAMSEDRIRSIVCELGASMLHKKALGGTEGFMYYCTK